MKLTFVFDRPEPLDEEKETAFAIRVMKSIRDVFEMYGIYPLTTEVGAIQEPEKV